VRAQLQALSEGDGEGIGGDAEREQQQSPGGDDGSSRGEGDSGGVAENVTRSFASAVGREDRRTACRRRGLDFKRKL